MCTMRKLVAHETFAFSNRRVMTDGKAYCRDGSRCEQNFVHAACSIFFEAAGLRSDMAVLGSLRSSTIP